MKRHAFLALMLLLALALGGCWDTQLGNPDGDEPDPSDGPTLGDQDFSGCKNELMAKTRQSADDPALGPVDDPIEVIAGSDRMTVIHHDAQYQCAAEMEFVLEADGMNLVLTEVDRSHDVADCICPMDLSTQILNLEPGIYHLEVWDEFHETLFSVVNVRIGECPDQCQMDADCYDLDLPHDDCIGNFDCINGVCEWICGDEPPLDCRSDLDCPSGYQCVYYDVPMPGDPEDPFPTEGYDEDTGVAEPGMPILDCMADSDCPEGMWCEMIDCVDMEYPDGSDCAPVGFCNGDFPEPEGVCEPVGFECRSSDECWENDVEPDNGMRCPGTFECINNMCIWQCDSGECFADSDCAPGEYCEFAVYGDGMPEDDPAMPDDPDMPYWEGGVCVPFANECFADSDCPAGHYCEIAVYDEDGVDLPWYEGGVCVPYPAACYDNSDCAAGEHCEFPVYDDNGPDLPHPDFGVCVPNDPISCEAYGGECFGQWEGQWDCPEGYQAIYESMYGEPLCGVGGICCVPKELEECRTDEQCYEMYGDVPEGRWVCMQGKCDIMIDPYCPPSSCQADSDCGYGATCQYEEICFDEAGECCGFTQCVGSGVICEVNADCPEAMACVNGVCLEDSCSCPEYYLPVCGENGETYSNPCFAQCEGVGVAYYRPCEENVLCTSSDECGPGQICSVEQGDCLLPPDCDDPDMDCPAVCFGECRSVGEPLDCAADGECPQGMYCNGCPPDPNCPECDVCGSPVCDYLPD